MCRCWAVAWLQAGVWLRHQVGSSGLSLAAPKILGGRIPVRGLPGGGTMPLLCGALRVGTLCHWCAVAVLDPGLLLGTKSSV